MTIIGQVLTLAVQLVSNALLGKWIGAAQFWWFQLQNPILKKAAEQQYNLLLANFQALNPGSKPPAPPAPPTKG